MKTVKEMLAAKGAHVVSIAPNETVYDAITLLSEKNIGALPVIDGVKLVGIISERDYARRVILQGKSSKETKVSEIMSANVLVVTPEMSNEACLAIMNEKCLRHLPVVENDLVIGMISIGDVVKVIISEQHFTIDNLQQYIMHG